MTACRQTKGTTSKLREQIQAAGVGDCDYLHYDQAIANAAADYLKTEAPSDHPWCLYVGFTTPHYPLKVPAELLKLYEPFDQFPIDPSWHHPEHLHPALQKYKETTEINDSHISEQELQRAIAAYYALVTFMDSQVGVVLEALRQAGLEATTRILYLDDHGDSAGEQGLFFKSTMNEGSVRIPLILSGPDLPKGYRVRENVSIVDLYQTVMEFSGLPLNAEEQSLPGVSLIKTLQGNGDPHRCIYSEYHAAGFDNSVFMLKKDQMKLIHYVGYDRPQLFDLAADPEEQWDLALDPQYQPLIEELEQELHNICDPEALNAQSMQDQQNLIAAKGGLEAILKQGLTPFTAVPQAYETKS